MYVHSHKQDRPFVSLLLGAAVASVPVESLVFLEFTSVQNLQIHTNTDTRAYIQNAAVAS